MRKALSDLLTFAKAPIAFSNNFDADMLREMRRVFPQKAVYVGEAGLRALIDEVWRRLGGTVLRRCARELFWWC